ncbi:MAG: hypothetical protein ACRD4Q_01700 [Candidatus Acidiferrales bacterium]
MGQALDTISGFVTAPGNAFTQWTPAAGDSLTVRNANSAKRTMLLNLWGWNNAAGTLRVRSPKLHDNVQGIRASVLSNDVEVELAVGQMQTLYPQDSLVAEQTGSAVAGQIETGSMLLWYEDLPGVAGRFLAPADIAKRQINVFTNEVTIAPGAAGGYQGQQAFNSAFDLTQANTDYALLGYVVSARCATVALRGPDTGNLRCAGPGEPTKRDLTSRWFYLLSSAFALPLIPVINSANKAGTFIDIVANQAAGAVTVDLIMAQLSPAS